MMNESCRTCHFWWWMDDDFGGPDENRVYGRCRRYPPVYTGELDDEANIHDEWNHPATLHHHWCGEWKLVRDDSIPRPLPKDDSVVAKWRNPS